MMLAGPGRLWQAVTSRTNGHAQRSRDLLIAQNSTRSSLSPGLATACSFRFFHRAEPACALADGHLDLPVPAAARLVIDALARPVDIALDGAVGRGRDRSRCRRQQDRMGVGRWLGGAENRGLLVA